MAKKTPINIYTEITPNPLVMKFVMDKIISNDVVEFKSLEEAKKCPLAIELFNFPFIKEIFIAKNYISICKYNVIEWEEVANDIRDFLRKYMQEKKPIFITPSIKKEKVIRNNKNKGAIEQKIISILKKHVQPAVEMDGGNIEFHSFENGVVNLVLQGACSGCPSSTITLKSGIEELLKKMIPNKIKNVVAING